jgi:hypothetical protein
MTVCHAEHLNVLLIELSKLVTNSRRRCPGAIFRLPVLITNVKQLNLKADKIRKEYFNGLLERLKDIEK